MRKTYSVCIQLFNHYTEKPYWVTNWHQYEDKGDIDWEKIRKNCEEKGYLAYGYVHGYESRHITSVRYRTVLWRKETGDELLP